MDPSKFANKIRQVASLILSNRERDLLIVSKDLRALIVRRVQQTGINANGESYGKYSTRASDKVNKSSVSKSKRGRLKKGFVSYEDIRAAQGLQVNFKDFTFSGKMMRSIQARVAESEELSTVVSIAPSPEEEAKLRSNENRDGKIIEASEEEKEIIRKTRVERLENILKSI